jgi:hypothetical protein
LIARRGCAWLGKAYATFAQHLRINEPAGRNGLQNVDLGSRDEVKVLALCCFVSIWFLPHTMRQRRPATCGFLNH